MAFQNPAELFLEDQSVSELDDVISYANFLRREAGVMSAPPIDLTKIFAHFGMSLPKYVPLPKQQGLTIFNNCVPTIVINETDGGTRQRFTEAHELIELLFHELPGEIRIDQLKENIFGTRKERICQFGAANLLMPLESFLPKASQLEVSFKTAEFLAAEYEVSLIASLFRLVDVFTNKTALVMWKMKNKPSEILSKIPKEQILLPGFNSSSLPPPKLRVEWSYGKFQNTFIPDNKSVEDDSSVYSAWMNDQLTIGEELSPFGKYNRRITLENKPVRINGEKYVLSLIKQPS